MSNPTILAQSQILAYRCVKMTSTGGLVVPATSSSDAVFGVTKENITQINEPVILQENTDQLVILTAGGSISSGDFLIPSTNGTVVTSSAGPFVASANASSGQTLWAKKIDSAGSSSGIFSNLTVTNNAAINTVTVGKNALGGGTNNTVVGEGALGATVTGSNNTTVGYQAGRFLAGASNNTFVGRNAGSSLVGLAGNNSGYDNTLIGSNAGSSLVGPTSNTGTTNTFIGSSAGQNVTTASGSTIVGYIAGLNTTTGGENVFVGARAGRFNTTGTGNVAVGNDALRGISTTQPFRGTASTAVGASALLNVIPSATALSNTAVGFQAGLDTRTGSYNVAVGNQALVSNLIGDSNTAVGEYSGDGCKQSNNVYVGRSAAYRNWFGSGNVMIGQSAGLGNGGITNQKDEYPNRTPSTTTGSSPYNASQNTVIGFEAFKNPADTTFLGDPIIETVTMTQTVGSAIVVTKTAHGLNTRDPVAFRSSAINPSAAGNANVSLTLLPSPLFSGRTYYVIKIDNNTYQLAQSPDETATNGFNVATPILCTAATGSGTYSRVAVGTNIANGNTIVGYQAGLASPTSGSQFSGTYNCLFGYRAGDTITSGNNNIVIGKDQEVDSVTGNDQINIGGKYFHNRLITTPLTKAQLDALPGLVEGMRGFCTDATATTFASTLAGGGSNNVPVYYDGVWKIG